MLVAFTLATAGVVLIVVALTTESWWLLAPALVAHAFAFMVTTGLVLKATEQQAKPDPVTEARIEAEPGQGDAPAGAPGGDRGREDDDEPKMAI